MFRYDAVCHIEEGCKPDVVADKRGSQAFDIQLVKDDTVFADFDSAVAKQP